MGRPPARAEPRGFIPLFLDKIRNLRYQYSYWRKSIRAWPAAARREELRLFENPGLTTTGARNGRTGEIFLFESLVTH